MNSDWVSAHCIYADRGSRGSLRVLNFGASSTPSENDWHSALAAETRELEARRAATRLAESSQYRSVNVPRAPLRDGHSIPLVGLGTWKADRGQVRSAVHAALRAGYRHIDCAAVYQNEEEVGEAFAHVLGKGFVDRKELFVCSKLWNTDHAAPRVREACLRSLKALQLDYLDLYMVHWPVTGIAGPEIRPSLEETWSAMEALVSEGLVRSLGVSNFGRRKLERLLACARIPPAVLQVEAHPYWRNDALLSWARAQNLHVTAFSPLGSPDSASIFPRALPLDLRQEPAVLRVARGLHKDVGQVLIRWALEHGTSVIPKSTSPQRISSNLEVLDWCLGEESYRALSSLPVQQRMVNGASWLNPRGPYSTMEALWDEPEEGIPCPFPEPRIVAPSWATTVERGTSEQEDAKSGISPQLSASKEHDSSTPRSHAREARSPSLPASPVPPPL
ncbi:aldo-keto reductase, partial [Helicosporidium sp. ATCC 50920]